MKTMSKCDKCGRFIKAGGWNYIQHDYNCPSKEKTYYVPTPITKEYLEDIIDSLDNMEMHRLRERQRTYYEWLYEHTKTLMKRYESKDNL